ncbi:MAG: EAL domain-containing protein [Atopobiaceae bacterium]|nr:EAL domain-containing protein [Atopobiaceae bacterium]
MPSPDMRTVLAHTIAMMRQIGKKVLIEGVETVEQSEELCKMGADYLQGYLYARPMSQDEFVAFLKQNNA